MMRVVVDTNIIFSALLPKSSNIRDILLSKGHRFYSPNYVFSEIFKYKEKILKHTKLNETELYEYLNRILENIQFIRGEVASKENRLTAFNLCKEIDEKDSPFIALAIEIEAYVWTGDKKLIKGLEEKGFTKFADIELLDSSSRKNLEDKEIPWGI
jgi:putative PIN family toxin of toxin-antitoxin system